MNPNRVELVDQASENPTFPTTSNHPILDLPNSPQVIHQSQQTEDDSSQSKSELVVNQAWDFPEIRNRFVILSRIGQGTFSTVYKAQSIHTNTIVALKRIHSISSPSRIDREVRIIYSLEGKNHVGGILGCLRSGGHLSVVLPYYEHTPFQNMFLSMDVEELRQYMTALFTSLAYIHEKNIIHRDIKPSNFLYSPTLRKYALVDFGLSEMGEYELQLKENTLHFLNDTFGCKKASRAGTKGFRAPEILLKVFQQTSAIDIWSAGVIFLCVLSGRFPFFRSPDDLTGLAEIASIFGTNEVATIGSIYSKRVGFPKYFPPKNLQELCIQLNQGDLNSKVPQEAYDLLQRCLDVNPASRITAKDALNHPFLRGTTT